MDTTTIYQKVLELVQVIKNSDDYKKCLKLEEELLINQESSDLLNNFHKHKEKYEEAMKYGEYYPGLDKIKQDFQKAKVALMNNDLFKEYKMAEKKLDSIIFEIESKLRQVVNIKEKHNKSIIKFL